MHIIAGLGNPGEEYTRTRHNAGRMALQFFREKKNFPAWVENKKYKALVSEEKIGKEKILLIMPETFMNKSGTSLVSLVTSKKKAENLVVIYDDLDLPIGKFKISFNRGSGGHRGLESIIKNLKTEAFLRIRVGISPTTPTGKIKKPQGERNVADYILGEFRPQELEKLKRVFKDVSEAISMTILDGREKAMGEFN